MTKEAIAKAPERRVRRGPLGRKNVLTVSGKDPDFVYRIVNDRGNNIQDLLDMGYVFEENKETIQVGDKRIGRPSIQGSSNIQLDVGQGDKAFLMKQRKDWYDEDQAAKQAYVKQTEDAVREEATKDGAYGKIEITRS